MVPQLRFKEVSGLPEYPAKERGPQLRIAHLSTSTIPFSVSLLMGQDLKKGINLRINLIFVYAFFG